MYVSTVVLRHRWPTCAWGHPNGYSERNSNITPFLADPAGECPKSITQPLRNSTVVHVFFMVRPLLILYMLDATPQPIYTSGGNIPAL